MTPKSEAFHRLAAKRVETISDALRIFSNLSGPSYEWTPDEVLTYAGQIEEATKVALDRFRDTKRWRDHAPPRPPEPAPPGSDEPEAPEPPPAPDRETRRSHTIRELLAKAEDPETLAATIVLQREVIERQQEQLNALRPQP